LFVEEVLEPSIAAVTARLAEHQIAVCPLRRFERVEGGCSLNHSIAELEESRKNTKLSLVRASITLAAVIILLVFLATTAPAQTAGDQKSAGEWKTVEDVFGFPGTNLPGGVVRFNMPRKELHVTLNGTEIKPGLGLGAWVAFHRIGGHDAMVIGDLVLTEDEVAP
jgi:hypothetical protein